MLVSLTIRFPSHDCSAVTRKEDKYSGLYYLYSYAQLFYLCEACKPAGGFIDLVLISRFLYEYGF